MSRKSKRGFKKLQDHELVELASIQPGSDSEIELELRAAPETSSGGCGGSCCWCIGLYLVLLTCIMLLVGAFSGYLAYNLWELSDNVSDNHKDLDGRIKEMEASVKATQEKCKHQYIALGQHIENLNISITDLIKRANLLNASVLHLQTVVNPMSETVTKLQGSFGGLNERLKKIEDNPQEELINQVEAIHGEMRRLNGSTTLLNQSLSDIQSMRNKMASMGSVMESYDSQLKDLHRDLGDLSAEQTELEEKVGGLSEGLTDVQGKVDEVQKSIATSHEEMQQSSDLLSDQFTNLQVIVSALNDSTRVELGQLWTNLTEVEAREDDITDDVEALRRKVESLRPPSQDLPPATTMQKEDDTTASSPTTQTATESAPSATPTEVTPPAPVDLTSPTTSAPEATEGPSPLTDSPSTAEEPTPHAPPDQPSSVDHSNHAVKNQSSGTDSTGATEDVPEAISNNATKTDVDDESSTSTTDIAGVPGSPDSTSATEAHPDDDTPTTTNATDVSSTEQSNATSTEPSTVDQSETKTGDGGENTQQQAIQALAGLLSKFHDLDSNRDGALSRIEFSQYTGSVKVFQILDENRDGYITYEEVAERLKIFRAMETNKKYDTQQSPYDSYSNPGNPGYDP